MPKMPRPELLSPAGDFEKLEMALAYGADAVYLSGTEFGMRAKGAAFSDEELRRAAALCRSQGKKLYITCNTLPRQQELSRLDEYLAFLQHLAVDGLIIADLGVLDRANIMAPDLPKHVSTQLGVVNSATARLLHRLGASTVVLARELSLEEIRSMTKELPGDLRIEAFVHGAMCVSFSGRCLLSNYLTGRDANRGQCAQPCRWKYHLVEETRGGEYYEITEDGGTFILNSKDLCMIEHLGELYEAGISSFKIEGRMKSAYYTAIVTAAYRAAIDDLMAGNPFNPKLLDECHTVSHREYTTGFYYGEPGQYYGSSSYTQTAEVVAVVESCDQDGHAVLTQRNKFASGEALELVRPGLPPLPFIAENVPLTTAHAKAEFTLDLPAEAGRLSLLRRLKHP